MTKKMYYYNEPCVVLSEFNDKSVIEIEDEVDVYLGPEAYEDTAEITKELIVLTSDLKEKPYNIDEEIKEQHRKLQVEMSKQKKQLADAKREAERELRDYKRDLENELKDLKEKVSKFDGLEQMYTYLNEGYKYVVYNRYGNTYLRDLDEIKCSSKDSDLAAVSFRKHSGDSLVKMYVSRFSDDSGSDRYEAKGFNDLDDAITYFQRIINSYDYRPERGIIKECEKWGIKNKKIEEYKQSLINHEKEKLQAQIERAAIEKINIEKSIERLNRQMENDTIRYPKIR